MQREFVHELVPKTEVLSQTAGISLGCQLRLRIVTSSLVMQIKSESFLAHEGLKFEVKVEMPAGVGEDQAPATRLHKGLGLPVPSRDLGDQRRMTGPVLELGRFPFEVRQQVRSEEH